MEPTTSSQHRDPRPDPLMLTLQMKRCKGSGQVGQTAQEEEEEGPETRSSTSSYLRTNNTETMQRKQEKVREGRERKKRKIMRALHMPQQYRCHLKRGHSGERKPRRLWPTSHCPNSADVLLPLVLGSAAPTVRPVSFRQNTRTTEKPTRERSGASKSREITPVHNGRALSTSQGVFTPSSLLGVSSGVRTVSVSERALCLGPI